METDLNSARDIIEHLNLLPHPEGGWYRETWRAAAVEGHRPSGTAIYYLLEADDVSHWHKVDAVEIWHWHAGGPLALTISSDGVNAENYMLGPALHAGQEPQRIVPADWWQCAASLGVFTLVSCTVSPGFHFGGFTLAPPDWRPGAGPPE